MTTRNDGKTWKAVKITRGTGQARWHINDPDTDSEKSICGQVRLDKGKDRPGALQEIQEREFQDIEENSDISRNTIKDIRETWYGLNDEEQKKLFDHLSKVASRLLENQIRADKAAEA